MAKMTEAHKKALAKGREQGRAVREYLAALETERKPGRKLSRDELQHKIKGAQEKVDGEPDPLKRVELIQRRIDLEERLNAADNEPDVEALQEGFVQAAKDYGERKGITYSAWREAGVPAAVLKEAGVARTRRVA